MSRNGLSNTALKRLINEERRMKKEKDRIFIAIPRNVNNKPNYKIWDVYFLLPDENSFYKDKVIEAEMTFPENYPHQPPTFIFKTQMFHPNIYTEGKVCISILEEDLPGPMGCGTSEDRWSPVQNIRVVCLSMVILLDNPNPDSPANVDAAKLFREIPNDEYKKKVLELIDKEDRISREKEHIQDILKMF